MKVSVIGLRGHAGRHIQMVQETPLVELHHIYYHKEVPLSHIQLPITNRIEECLDSDAIIISSPTHLHLGHLKMLDSYKGYILLEKPAVNTRKDLYELNMLSEEFKGRIYINFNFWFSDVALLIREIITKRQLGEIISFSFHSSHGGAFRDDWASAWRTAGIGTGLGPLETTGIHYLHFTKKVFGNFLRSFIFSKKMAHGTEGKDTGIINLETENGIHIRLSHSYAAPYSIRTEIIGTEGLFLYDGEIARLYWPRDTFDEKGLFKSPPLKNEWKINFAEAWKLSLNKSFQNFIEKVKKQERQAVKEFDFDAGIIEILCNGQQFVERV